MNVKLRELGWNAHSGPTPRGRGASDAAFAVAVRRGRRIAIEDKLCLPIVGAGGENWSSCCRDFWCHISTCMYEAG